MVIQFAQQLIDRMLNSKKARNQKLIKKLYKMLPEFNNSHNKGIKGKKVEPKTNKDSISHFKNYYSLAISNHLKINYRKQSSLAISIHNKKLT